MMTQMIKTTLLVMATAGLTGCAVYPAAPYGTAYEPSPVYVTPSPVFIGGAVYHGPPRGYHRPQGPQRPHLHGPRPGHGPQHRHPRRHR